MGPFLFDLDIYIVNKSYTVKAKIKRILREHYGSFSTNLEKEYEDKITSVLLESDDDIRHEWATYNQVILELKKHFDSNLRVKELLYRLTEGCDPSKECITVIEKVKNMTPEMRRLYDKIKLF